MINDKTSAASIRWMLNLWPPFLFQGIRVLDIENEFLSARIRVRRSILTRNLMGTTFGGALASAADPFYPILYWRWLSSRGYSTTCWIRQMNIEFVRPADHNAELHFKISEAQCETARLGIETKGRIDLEDEVEATLPGGEVAARFRVVSALRSRSNGSTPHSMPNSID